MKNKSVQIMGILNITPDSFSDGGRFFKLDDALRHASSLVEEGADILDIGAESTRPNHEPVCAQEEMARLLPVLKEVRRVFPKIKISVDTYKGEVAKAAVEDGADIINDVWGGMYEKLFGSGQISTVKVSALFDCPIVLMHNRPQNCLPIVDFPRDVFSDFDAILENAQGEGVAHKNIILDGGFGFAKTPRQNIELVQNYGFLRKYGFPLLLGLSRKSTLRLNYGIEGADDATLAFDMWACINKVCDIIRVHDVARHRLFLKSLQLIESSLKWTK